MLELEGILTDRVEKLLNETKNLNPDRKIQIMEMTDENALQNCDGALVRGDLNGEATIFLDLQKADEYRLAHEILHIKYLRSGWPKFTL